MMARNAAVFALYSLVALVFLSPITAMLNLGLRDDRYITVIAAPAIFAALMYWDRRRIFSHVNWDPAVGLPLLVIALSVWPFLFLHNTISNPDTHLNLAGLTIVVAGAGAFTLCYGRQSLAAAAFPFFCLLLAVPLPAWIMDRVTTALQHGSAATSVAMLRFFGIPVFAQDTHLSLRGLDVEVAPECSGIRSCLSLLLIIIVVSRVGLRSNISRLVLILSTIPLAIVKNAFRISVIATLSAYVDHAYINSPIHHYGGFVFTPLQIAILAAL
ncbi:MAG TPA: exosortase/archaeosortase family protein, partial [Terriglobales bacterium]|nr:exosortase/archaeosortase family protein [Terriglobales bacterium]